MANPTQQSKKPIFGYWNIRGFGQPVRYILKYLNIDFEERLYACSVDVKFRDWDSEKHKLGLDFPNLPYWIDGDVKMTESRAIIKHLARENDATLLPHSFEEQRRADMLDGVVTDIWNLLVDATYINTEDTLENYDRQVPAKLEQVSKFIGNNTWSLGNNISYLDFIIYEILYHNRVFRPEILNEYPVIIQLMKRFEALPPIAAFMKSPAFIQRPCFRPWAKHQI